MAKYIKCPKCEDFFGHKLDHIKVARILKCGDSICQECLEKMIKETDDDFFLCPECNFKVKKKKNLEKYTINKGMINTINGLFNIGLNDLKDNEKNNATKYTIIALGDFAVGKSSIFQRLSKDYFSINHLTTIGFNQVIYNIKFRNNYYKLKFSDTAGQERYRSIAKSIMRESDGALFIYDITNRESFKDLEYWYDLYKKEKENVVGLVIGNKCECESERKIDFDEGKEFAEQHKLNFLETSAKLDKNLKKAITIILDNIMESKESFNSISTNSTITTIDSESIKLNRKKMKKRKCAC